MNRPPIYFETIAKAPKETPQETKLGDAVEDDIKNTIARIYAPLNRQASDGVTLVALALVIATAALLLRLIVEN